MNGNIIGVNPVELPRWRVAVFAAAATILTACGQETGTAHLDRAQPRLEAGQEAPINIPSNIPVESSSSSSSTTTVLTLQPETTEAPRAPRMEDLARPSRSIGKFVIPRMCNLAVDIVAMPHEQVNRFGEDTVVDALPPDPNPNPGCAAATENAAQQRRNGNPKHAARSERTNPGEYKGFANQFVPTAAWDMASVMPGKPGISVMPGHRTTHTAPFSELDMVQPGDAAELQLASGETVGFKAIYNGVLRESNGDVVIPGQVIFDPNKSYIVSYACAPQRSSEFRQVAVWEKL